MDKKFISLIIAEKQNGWTDLEIIISLSYRAERD
jgi:hypothetical protein